MFLFSRLTASNTKRGKLTRLSLELMHRGRTWHDYPWRWVSLTWWLYNLQLDDITGADFENFHCTLSANQKRDESSFRFSLEARKMGTLLHLNLETVCSNGSTCMHFWRLATSFVTELKHPDQCELFYWQIHPAMMEVPRYQVTSLKWKILLQKVRMLLFLYFAVPIKILV